MSIEIRSYLQRHPTVPHIQKKLWIRESKLESENYEEEEGFENERSDQVLQVAGSNKRCRPLTRSSATLRLSVPWTVAFASATRLLLSLKRIPCHRGSTSLHPHVKPRSTASYPQTLPANNTLQDDVVKRAGTDGS